MAEDVTYTIADFMEWMVETQELTDEMAADIANAQELLEKHIEDGDIDLSNENDAVNINNLWYAIINLELCDEYRQSDENYNGYIWTETPTLSTNFSIMVESAYTADTSWPYYSKHTHFSSYGGFQNLCWFSLYPVESWYTAEKNYFDKCRDELGYSAPLTSDEYTAVINLANEKDYDIGHYCNILIAEDQIAGIGICFYSYNVFGSNDNNSVSSFEGKTNGEYNLYTISEFKAYFEEYYESLYGEDSLTQAEDLISLQNECTSMIIGASDSAASTGESLTYYYTGFAVEPSINIYVNDDHTQLVEGTDYIITYEDNIEPGTATMIIKGINNCVGYLTETFEIVDSNGFITLGDETYYYIDNVRQYGWITVGSKVYYFDEETGVMQTGWQTIGGEIYYFASSGELQTGKCKIDDAYYYFDEETGVMRTGLQTIDGKTYYFDESGIMQSGLVTINGNTYYFEEYATYAYMVSNSYVDFDDGLRYFDENGVMAVGWYDTYFYYDESGVMMTGWQTIDGETYYFEESGVMQTGLTVIDGNYYYFDEETGIMQTGFVFIEYGYYYFDEDGIMQTGWVTINGNTYYFDPVMQTGSVGINGVQYYFDEETGILQADENDSSSDESSGGTTGTTDGSSSTDSNDGDVNDSSGSGTDLDSNVSDSGSDSADDADDESADGISGVHKAQKITIKKSALKKTVKAKKLKKKKQTFKLKASTSGNGKITYKKVSGNKKIKISKAGKVTVKKGLKKGKTYKVKVKVTAAKTSTYKKATKTVTLKIKIN